MVNEAESSTHNSTFPVWILVILPLGGFAAQLLPFATVLPDGDGLVDVRKGLVLYQEGWSAFLKAFPSAHPPLGPLVTALFLELFGYSVPALLLRGLLFGCVGIIAAFKLGNRLFAPPVGVLWASLLAVNPLFVVSAHGCLIDFMVTNLTLACVGAWAERKYFRAASWGVLAVMIKETALLLPVVILLTNSIEAWKAGRRTWRLITPSTAALLAPLLLFGCWLGYLRTIGIRPWEEFVWASTAHQGALYTVAWNVVTFGVFNEYFWRHIQQLLFLNYLYIPVLIIAMDLVVSGTYKNSLPKVSDRPVVWTILIFSVAYALLVFSFQTWTIPRYELPVVVFVILFSARALVRLFSGRPRAAWLCSAALAVSVSASTMSIDPLPRSLWGTLRIDGQEIYNTLGVSGGDGITYNMQYLKISRLKPFSCDPQVAAAFGRAGNSCRTGRKGSFTRTPNGA